MGSWDDDDGYDGLPDAAFTEDELAAGVQHIARTGNPNATSSGRRSVFWSQDHVNEKRAEDAKDMGSSRSAAPLRFETYAQAQAWSQANPGKVFARATDGRGFESKPVLSVLPVLPVLPARSFNHVQHRIDSYRKRSAEIESLAPHLHDVLSHSASNGYRITMRPFYRRTWEDELSRLTTAQLSRLRLLVAAHLEASRESLRQIYVALRRFRSMKAGHYGEALTERLNKLTEGALKDIDKRLAARRGGDWDVPF